MVFHALLVFSVLIHFKLILTDYLDFVTMIKVDLQTNLVIIKIEQNSFQKKCCTMLLIILTFAK